ncbi:MAG TPA: T9SS type A sorting domain-containing protein [Bacteroidia bacterium]|nr:T9SS type A sorting domain-containing protein [Bacteroidia bacterium]
MKKLLFICLALMACLKVGQAQNGNANRLYTELQSFSAASTGEKVDMDWKVTEDIRNTNFTVEKSKDGVSFTTVFDVPAAEGSYKDYAEADYEPFEGISYYRLKETEKNGACKYSMISVVNFVPQKKVTVYPNPILGTSNLSVNLNGFENQEVFVVVKNMQGSEVVSKSIVTKDYNETFVVEGTNSLPMGNYVVTVLGNNKIYNYKVIVK